MHDYADEVFLHARIYAMYSRLLSLKDYALMASDQDEAFYNKTPGTSDPITAKETVFKEQISGIINLAEATDLYTPLFLAFLRQFEAFNAKLIFAKAFGMKVLEQWYDIGPYAVLQRSMLKDKISLKDIQPLLIGTYLEDTLEDTSSYEQIEIRTDMCVARELFRASSRFTPIGKMDFQELMGRRIAIISTILAMRLKNTYQWDDEKIRPYLERFHNIFGGKASSQVKVVEKLLTGHLERQQAIGTQESDGIYMEHYLEQNFYNWVLSVFHRDFHSIWCVAAYLWLLYFQIRNLFRIIEGRRFGFDPEHILSRIICRT